MNETVHVKPLSLMPGACCLGVILLGSVTHTSVRNEWINSFVSLGLETLVRELFLLAIAFFVLLWFKKNNNTMELLLVGWRSLSPFPFSFHSVTASKSLLIDIPTDHSLNGNYTPIHDLTFAARSSPQVMSTVSLLGKKSIDSLGVFIF